MVAPEDQLKRLNGMVSDFLSYGRPPRLVLRACRVGLKSQRDRDESASPDGEGYHAYGDCPNGRYVGFGRRWCDIGTLEEGVKEATAILRTIRIGRPGKRRRTDAHFGKLPVSGVAHPKIYLILEESALAKHAQEVLQLRSNVETAGCPDQIFPQIVLI
jgi:hypothetical protein